MSADPHTCFNEVVEEMIATSPATAGKFFSIPSLKIDGKVFAGLYRETMIFKLPLTSRIEALSLAGAYLFDPSERGQAWKEWVVVPVEHAARWAGLAREAFEYVSERS